MYVVWNCYASREDQAAAEKARIKYEMFCF